MAKGPVFVAGCPRSGTSALGWAVPACAEYWTSVETHFLFRLLAQGGRNPTFDAFRTSNLPGSWLDEHAVTYEEFLSCIGSGLNSLMLSRSNQVQWVDNSPENLLVGNDLLIMFPDAVIIHSVRDPRDVCASMLLSNFHREVWSRDLDEAIETWTHYAAIGRSVKTRHPDRVMEVMHSRLLGDPDAVAAELGLFLEIPDGSAIAHFLKSERVNSSYDTASKLAGADGQLTAASAEERQSFLRKNAKYILKHCEPYASDLGFRELVPEERLS